MCHAQRMPRPPRASGYRPAAASSDELGQAASARTRRRREQRRGQLRRLLRARAPESPGLTLETKQDGQVQQVEKPINQIQPQEREKIVEKIVEAIVDDHGQSWKHVTWEHRVWSLQGSSRATFPSEHFPTQDSNT